MPENKPKIFYSCLDLTVGRIASQAVQHLVIGQFAQLKGGTVTFYTGENVHTRYTHEVILGKVAERPKVDGFIFYRLNQLLSPSGPAVKVMRAILDSGYEFHCAMDKVSLLKPRDLDDFFPMLIATANADRRDPSRDYFEALVRAASPDASTL